MTETRAAKKAFFLTWLVLFAGIFWGPKASSQPHCAKNKEDLKSGKRSCGLIIPQYVSLAPHLTETLYALGALPVVATTEQCDFPAEAQKTLKVGSYSSPQFELILKTNPSHVFATEGNPRALLEKLREEGVSVIESNPKTVREVPDAIVRLAKVAQMGELQQKKAAELAKQLQKAIGTLPGPQKNGPTALLALQWEPLYSVNESTWLGDFLTQAGYRNVMSSSKIAYPAVSQEYLLKNKPDLVFVVGSWKPVAKDTNSSQELDRVVQEARTKLTQIYGPKAKLPNVVVLPPDIFVRPGPRLVDAISFFTNLPSMPSRKGP